MTEWFRRKTWTKKDEEEFFSKLGRARKSGRPQYLRIQAIELIETKNKDNLKVAESLLKKVLTEFPDDKFDRGPALNTLGEIYKLTENYSDAIDYYRQAIDFEEVYPNVKTNAYLDYSELIIKTGTINQFDFVEKVLLERIPEQIFPLEKYKSYSILSVIYNYKNQSDQAKIYSDLADQNSNSETSGLRYHKYLGIVKERDVWLDRLVKRD